ncbi:MAG: DUF1638 domain-containing protein, partial [Fusobacteriaceae bacterium]
LQNRDGEFDVVYIGMENDDNPSKLRELITKEIRKAEGNKENEKIILLYGLCGNSVEGISSTLPIVIPKAYDCCAIFLESSKKFHENFSERLSAEWYTSSHLRKIEELRKTNEKFKIKYSDESLKLYIEKYGEENGRFLYETLITKKKDVVFIKTQDENDEKNISELREQYEKVEVIEGGNSYIEKILNGTEDEEILELKIGKVIISTYDVNVITSK